MLAPLKLQWGALGATGLASAARRTIVAAWCLAGSVVLSATTANGATLPAASQLDQSACQSSQAQQALDTLRRAIIASGETKSSEVDRYVAQFERLANELNSSLDRGQSTGEQAQAILQFLHRRLFTGGYDAACHDPRRAFDRGEFNCVGGTLLFYCLAAHCGIDSHAMLITGHVWCRVDAQDERFDVETTNDRWQPGDEIGGVSAESPEPRELDTAGLVALVRYNRSVVELESGNYPAAIAAARAALELDAQANFARDNLAAAYNNWAVQCSESGDHEQALELLTEARTIAPEDERLTANARRLYARSYEAQVAAGEYFAANKTVAAATIEFPGDDYFRQAERAMLERNISQWLRGFGVPALGLLCR